MAEFDNEKGRFVWEDEAPDPQRCNLAHMMRRWGCASDPDEPIPQGPSWRTAFVSKEWQKKRKSEELGLQPLMDIESSLKKLSGVLVIDRVPEVRLNDENKRKIHGPSCAVNDGWKPQNEQELQEHLTAIRLSQSQWETEGPPQLTITVNLQAPSYLILGALEVI